MKIDRLLAILNLLSEYKVVTAPELASRFEVSRRTINRDIEDLCKAGIPIVTRQGKNGGISIMDGFTLDKRLLKKDELTDIIAGLKGIESVSKSSNNKFLQTRLSDKEGYMIIDLASHYKNSLSDKIDIIKCGIFGYHLLSFDYYGPQGKQVRCVEPYKVMYKWSDWYLLGYCRERQAMRVFKLNRLWNLKCLGSTFTPRKITEEDLGIGSYLMDDKSFEVIFDSSVQYIIVETYGPESYTTTPDGNLYFKGSYTNESFIIRWLLGFGNKAKVISPKELINKLKKNIMIFDDGA